MPLRVSTLVGDSLVLDRVFRYFVVTVRDTDTYVDLIIIDKVDFDVILGIDRLSHFQASMNFFAKTVPLAMPGKP